MSQLDEDLSEEDIEDIRKQIKDYDFKAGKEDYQIFLEGPIWADLKENLEERVSACIKNLEDLSNSHMIDIVYKARLHELRQLLAYPETVINLLENLEDDSNDSIS